MGFTVSGRHVIVVGDRTTHGGEVLTGDENFTFFDIPVARIGDKVSCPQCGGVHRITEGAEEALDKGIPIAVHDCATSCGARLIAKSRNKIMGTSLEAEELQICNGRE